MSRSGYSDEESYNGQFAMWRGQVMSSIRGRRGQAFLRELIEALDAMPEKRLIEHELRREDGEVCALGCVGARRGMALESLDVHDPYALAREFGISRQLVQEIEYMNDDDFSTPVLPEVRWQRMRTWAVNQLVEQT